MSLLPGLLFTRRSAGAESAGGWFATHPGPQEAHFPLVQWQQEDKITTAPLTSCPAMYPVCVCLTLNSLGTSWIAQKSPAHPAWPGLVLQQPSKHKLIWKYKPLSQVAWIPRQPVPFCVCPTLQATAEKLCAPLVVVCYHMRGRSKVYSHLFQFTHKQHLWELWCIPH